MTLLILIKLIAIVILLLLSAISSGSETALTAVSKLQAHRQNEKGIKNSRFILRIKDLKDEFITGKLGLRTCHISLFDKKLKKVLKMSVKEKKFWLLTVRASRQYVIQKNTNEIKCKLFCIDSNTKKFTF